MGRLNHDLNTRAFLGTVFATKFNQYDVFTALEDVEERTLCMPPLYF